MPVQQDNDLNVTPSRKEECVSPGISPDGFAIIFLRLEFLPHACWKYVLVALIPSTINNLCHYWVILETFKALVRGSHGTVLSSRCVVVREIWGGQLGY